MTITTTALGTYTKQFSLSGENGMSGTISAVDTWITTASQPGWVLHDTVTSADGGGLITKVYKAINKDATSYKYLILRYETLKWRFMTSTCESWDTGTHAPTNEAFTFGDSMAVHLLPNSSDLVVFASPRYAIFQSFIRNMPDIWQGVIEMEREAPEDTAGAGYPCWAWINGQTYAQCYQSAHGSSDYYGTGTAAFSMPRTRNGATGIAAATNHVITSAILPNTGYNAPFADYLYTHSVTYGWDTNKKLIHTPKNYHPTVGSPQANYGRHFGLKITPPVGEVMNKVAVPVDSDKFFSAGGSNADHWVLPLVGKNVSVAYGEGATGGNYTTSSVSSATLGTYTYAIACNGLAYYCATNGSGVYKVDAATMSINAVSGTTGIIADIIYDGAQYLYAITNGTTLYRIDTLASDAVTSLTLPVACGWCMTQDYANVFVTGAAANAAYRQVYQVVKSSFTNGTAYQLTYAQTTAQVVAAMCTDYQGYLYSVDGSGATAADSRLYKTVISTGSTTQVAFSGTANAIQAGIHYDPVRAVLHLQWSSTGQNHWGASPTGTITYTPTTWLTGAGSAQTYKKRIDILPLNGCYNSFTTGTYAAAGVGTRLSFNNNGVLGGTSGYVQTIFGASAGVCMSLCTDGVRFIQHDATGASLRFMGGMNNKFVRGAGSTNGQVLLPV